MPESTSENLTHERESLMKKIAFGGRAFVEGHDRVSGAIARRTLQDIQAMKDRLAEVEAELGRRTRGRAMMQPEQPFPWRDFGGHGEPVEGGK